MRQDERREAASSAQWQWRSDRGVACGFVILAHLWAAWVMTRPSPAGIQTSPPMELVYIQLPPPASAQLPAQPRSPASAAMVATRPQLPRTVATIRASTTETPAAIPQTIADDRWDLATSHKRKDDGIRFSANKLPSGYNPVRMGPPERFRMRGQASLADIVREVSKSLFWPSGYSDDPCPGLKKAVQIFSKAGTDRQRDLLEDAVLLHSRYCD